MSACVLIAGAGHAGDAVAAALRQQGWSGTICMVSEEPDFPYERPPLSKAFLKGETDSTRLALRPAEFYESHGIQLLRNTRVLHIDRASQVVDLSDGSRRAYDYLVLATGSKHRMLDVPGATHPGVMQLRTLADAQRLKGGLQPGSRLAIVGGGYVGLEVAASVHALGITPIVIEREQRVLARVASEMLSQFVERLHSRQGTEIHLNAEVEALCPVTGVHLKDGRMIPCDAVLVGIGSLANDDLARDAGLDCNNGVLVDENCRTTDSRVFAIGDCARRDVPGFGTSLRLESIPSAQEQAKVTAAALMGRPAPERDIPWFWSWQFDTRIQIAGLLHDVAKSFVRGSPDSGSFAIYHVDSMGRLRAVEAAGSAPEFVVGKLLIKAAASIPVSHEQSSLAELKNLSLTSSMSVV